jgi:hypothetical protein
MGKLVLLADVALVDETFLVAMGRPTGLKINDKFVKCVIKLQKSHELFS